VVQKRLGHKRIEITLNPLAGEGWWEFLERS
jgi:hypothetical protein